MAYVPQTNSVVSFQSDPTKLLGHSSVSGTVGASIMGTVPINGIVPLTGATNLGKAVDGASGATDTGVAILVKHTADQVRTIVADGDYELLETDSLGSLHVNAESHHVFDTFNATTGWSALSTDTLNLATTTKHVTGTNALTFDKVDGAANTIFACIQKTLTSVDLGDVSAHDLLQGTFYLPTLTDVSYVFLRLGTDSSNYNEWRIPDTALTAATFLLGSQTIGDANYAGITGNGWNSAAVTYIAVGVAFDSETNTLAGIVFDEVSYHTNQHTSASLTAEVTTDINTPNINVQRVGGVATATNSGTLSGGVQRVVLATNSPATSVSGTVQVGNSSVQLTAGSNMVGSIATYQGNSPWKVELTSGSVLSTTGNSSVQLVNGTAMIGSVAVLQGTNPWVIANSSVMLATGINVIGSVATLQGTQPWLTQIVTSVATRPTPASVQLLGSNALVGSVAQAGNWLIQPASVQLLGSNNLIGSVAQAGNWFMQPASVQLMAGTNVAGSIAVLQGTNPWVTVTQASSIVGTYAEDTAHTTADKGLFTLGVRNDTMSSITSADGDYSPFAVGPIGELIVAPAPITKWTTAVTSVMSGTSVLLFSGPGASIFQYVTGVQVTNPGTTAAHVTFTEGLGAVASSMMFWAMAPAGGGSNMVFPTPIKTTLANKSISASVSAHASVYVMIEGYTVKQLT